MVLKVKYMTTLSGIFFEKGALVYGIIKVKPQCQHKHEDQAVCV